MSPTHTSAEAPPRALSTAEVAHRLGLLETPSDLARVVVERVATVAHHLAHVDAIQTFTPATWDDDTFWNVEAGAQQRSQYFAIGNAINFRYWTRGRGGEVNPVSGSIEGETFQGAMYMWRCLRRCVAQQTYPLLDARFLSSIPEAAFETIFSDDHGINPLGVAQDERTANLRDLGMNLLASWGGQFYNLAAASHGSIVNFAKYSAAFRAFDDPLFKLTMVNAIVHSGSRVYCFEDEPLPAIDYHLLRQALRQGIVQPAPQLAEKLMSDVLLSAEEAYELRRITLQAFVSLATQSGLSGEVIDNKYWLNRTRCVADPVCADPATAHTCPFIQVCAQETAYSLPLELTRYY